MHNAAKPWAERGLGMSTLLAALRVYQWPKNLVVFAALLFGGQLLDPSQVWRSVLAFVVLCAASSGTYLLNDWADVESDRRHPVKRFRPVASGAVSLRTAIAVGALLLAGSLASAFALGNDFGGAVALYIGLTLAYTFLLKRVFLVDVLTVAAGFVVRAVAGAAVLGVVFTNWLVVCTFFLALFLILGKRRQELEVLGDDSTHRAVFAHYSVAFLDTLILLAGAGALLTYVIYTCAEPTVERIGTDKLYLTIPFVAYGLFRYLHLVHHHRRGEDPSRTFLEDGPLRVAIVLWGIACAAIVYGARAL